MRLIWGILLFLLAVPTTRADDVSAQTCSAGFSSMAIPTAPFSAFAAFKDDIAKPDLLQFTPIVVEPSLKDYGVVCLPGYYSHYWPDEPEKELTYLLKYKLQIDEKIEKNLPYDGNILDVNFRIAEITFEIYFLHRKRLRIIKELIFDAKNSGDKDKLAKIEKFQEKLLKRCEQYGAAAIKQYENFISDYPDHNRIDEAIFYLAFLIDDVPRTLPDVKVKDPGASLNLVDRLIKEYPKSEILPFALILLGEKYYQDGDMKKALEYYTKVSKYEDSKVFDVARYRKAWCLYYQGDYQGAMKQFIEVHAVSDMARVYPKVGKAADAWDFFKKYGGYNTKEQMMRLGEYYLGWETWNEAIAVYQRLMGVFPEDHAFCEWLSIVTVATNIQGDKEKYDAISDLENLIVEYKDFNKGDHLWFRKEDCEKWTAGILLDQAVTWHREAVGTDGRPGTGDPDTMKMAVRLYDIVLDEFPGFDGLFKKADESKRLSHSKIAYWKAELLWHMKDWEGCAGAFDDVMKMDPGGEYAQAAACGSLLCKISAYQTLREDYKDAP